ncbi:MAG: LON peptidase substrate-binding domain-containing protein [Nannocystaceae bacterium]
MLDFEDMPAATVLASLPVFPLPNVVFFPGMVLPLNVFEERYLDLVDHVLDGGGHIGVPLLVRPADAFAKRSLRPPFERVFGIGRLVSHQRLSDGRRFIRLKGLGRAREIQELVPSHRFREVEAEALSEETFADDLERPGGRGELSGLGPLSQLGQSSPLSKLDQLVAQIERMASIFEAPEQEFLHSVLRIDDPRVALYTLTSFLPNVEILRAVDGDCMAWSATEKCPMLEFQQKCLEAATIERRVALLLERTGSWLACLHAGGYLSSDTLH